MAEKSTEERFLEKVKMVESGCHEWQSTLSKIGYGKFWLDGKTKYAHRVGYRLFKGEIETRQMVLHKCDNRKCVNPDHLYLGTSSDNAKDKATRYKGMWGNMKYSYETILKVRSLYAAGGVTQTQLAKMTGINQAHISRIIRKTGRLTN